MSIFSTIAGAIGGLGLGGVGALVDIAGGLKGIFGKKDKAPTPHGNLLSQAQGAREAAEKYGFSPLTMLQFGQAGGAGFAGGGAPPLASFEAISNGLRSLDDIRTGRQAVADQARKLELDIARLKYEQAQSGVVVGPVGYASQVGRMPALGRQAVTVVPSGGSAVIKHGPAALSQVDSKYLGKVEVPEPRLDRGSGIYIAGVHVRPAPGFSAGERAENEYGEIGGGALGVAKLGADVIYNFNLPSMMARSTSNVLRRVLRLAPAARNPNPIVEPFEWRVNPTFK